MFDRVEITVGSGDGGKGVVSFRREKFVPSGGPDGGDGGDGGDVVVIAEASGTSLRAFKQKRFYRAAAGQDGKGKKKHGRKGKTLVLAVPAGTVVLNKMQIDGAPLIADLEEPGQRVVVVAGGKGGLGNTHFASSTNRAPNIAQKGEAGEEKSIVLELRLIADVGIIGYPNVGKSTLLSAASAARPRIASYPFTTLEPVLGMAEVGQERFVLAEIPGIIDGAHFGRGLGHEFLRHVIRTKVLIHLIDGGSASPAEDMTRVNAELGLFDTALARKLQIVAVNKVDLPQVQARLAEIKDAFTGMGITPFFISAAAGTGLPELMAEAWRALQSVAAEAGAGEGVPKKVFHPRPGRAIPRVHKEGDVFVVVAPALERIADNVDLSDPSVLQQLNRQLARRGVSKALKKAGIKAGDTVRCGKQEWKW